MIYLEDSIHSVMNLYIPSAKLPMLHVDCRFCDVTTPHVMLKHARNISFKLPPLCCDIKGAPRALPRKYYLPFGDTLTYKDFHEYKC